MRKHVIIQIFNALSVVLFFSCYNSNDQEVSWTKENTRNILDSIGSSKIIAAYVHQKDLIVLKSEKEKNKTACKLVYRMNYPVFIDSLIYIKSNEYRSLHFNTTYLIKDSAVVTINYVKIIHPSSNWQGQTPWTQPYVTSFNRIDIDSK